MELIKERYRGLHLPNYLSEKDEKNLISFSQCNIFDHIKSF